jgi:hypothetical protein
VPGADFSFFRSIPWKFLRGENLYCHLRF